MQYPGKAGFNDRQVKAVMYVREKGRITNKEYVQLNLGITDRTALNDLNDMLKKRIIKAGGEKIRTGFMLLLNFG